MAYKDKAAEAKYKKEYSERNKEKIAAKAAARYQANKAKVATYLELNKDILIAKRKAYREANKQQLAEKRKANKDKITAQRKAYYKANKEKLTEKTRDHYKKNKDHYQANKRKTRTGFNAALFSACKDLQENKCGICREDFSNMPTTKIHADHCHSTNRPRGILCRNCNHALGLFKDSPEILLRAAAYLKDPPLGLL